MDVSGLIGIEHLTDEELDAILKDVEARGRAVHGGKPAGPIRGWPGKRVEDLQAASSKVGKPA